MRKKSRQLKLKPVPTEMLDLTYYVTCLWEMVGGEWKLVDVFPVDGYGYILMHITSKHAKCSVRRGDGSGCWWVYGGYTDDGVEIDPPPADVIRAVTAWSWSEGVKLQAVTGYSTSHIAFDYSYTNHQHIWMSLVKGSYSLEQGTVAVVKRVFGHSGNKE